MNKSKLIIGFITPIVCSIITGIAAFMGGAAYNVQQNSEINIEINNILGSEVTGTNESTNLRTSTSNLITAYETAKQELASQKKQADDSQSKMQSQILALQQENSKLFDENTKLKDFLLKDNAYTGNIDELVTVKQTSDKLHNLYLIDSQNYNVVDSVRDLYGDVHSVSYKLHSDSIAWAKFRLDGKYDLFEANIATNQETGSDMLISIEIYIDDVLVKRIDNITRDTNLIPLGPIAVRNGKILTIKALTIAGDGWRRGYCYITDDFLSVTE